MRVRLDELLKKRRMSAYRVARMSDGRISLSAIYRLKQDGGHAEYFHGQMLEALCDVLRVEARDLLERG